LRLLGLILRRIARELRLLRRSLETLLLLVARKAGLLSLQLPGIAGGLGSKGRLLLRSTLIKGTERLLLPEASGSRASARTATVGAAQK
jgi:hypothetical protein